MASLPRPPRACLQCAPGLCSLHMHRVHFLCLQGLWGFPICFRDEPWYLSLDSCSGRFTGPAPWFWSLSPRLVLASRSQSTLSTVRLGFGCQVFSDTRVAADTHRQKRLGCWAGQWHVRGSCGRRTLQPDAGPCGMRDAGRGREPSSTGGAARQVLRAQLPPERCPD